MRRIAGTLFALLFLMVANGSWVAGSASGADGCRYGSGSPGFACGSLTVPIDHGDPASRPLHLTYLVQNSPSQRRKPVMVMLTGGPGQQGIYWASTYTTGTLKPLTSKYRLAVIDQRGTGASGALNCPKLQSGSYGPVPAGECARSLGPERAFYDTGSTVRDLEALRLRLGQEQMALFGVSYGTIVAQQYARTFPERTSALVLDSTGPAGGVDPFAIDKFGSVPRILRELCDGGRCRNITSDPVDDLAWLQRRLSRGPIRGTVFDRHGRPRRRAMRNLDLFYPIVMADFDPSMRAATVGAVAAARQGDPAPLLRQMEMLRGSRDAPVEAISQGLFVATMCADENLPFSLSDSFDPAARAQAIEAAFAGIDPARYHPFNKAQVMYESPADMCRDWPEQRNRRLSDAPLPDVPALIISGRLDVRTPLETATQVAAELPRADLLKVPGTGHAVFAADLTGCVRRAVALWVKGAEAGNACRGRSNGLPLDPKPPRSLRRVAPIPSVPGMRGRAARAAILTAADAMSFGVQLYGAGRTSGGGLRGGTFNRIGGSPSRRPASAEVRLDEYQYLPGLRVSGIAGGLLGEPRTGRLELRGLGYRGELVLGENGRVTGDLNGRDLAFRLRQSRARPGAGSGDASGVGRRSVQLRFLSLLRDADHVAGEAHPLHRRDHRGGGI